MRLRRRPAEYAGYRINRRACRYASIQRECQEVYRDVEIGRGCCKHQRIQFVHDLVADRIQFGRHIGLVDDNADLLEVIEVRHAIVSHPHRDQERTGALRLRRRPAEYAGYWINRRACRYTSIQRECQHVGRNIRITCGSREAQRVQFVHDLAAYVAEHRRHVDLIDRNVDRLEVIETGHAAVVRHPYGDREYTRPLRLGRRPTEQTSRRINRRTCRCARIQRERQHVGRNIRITCGSREVQRSQFVNRLVPDRIEFGRQILLHVYIYGRRFTRAFAVADPERETVGPGVAGIWRVGDDVPG